MSKLAELLQRKRQQQIAAMTGTALPDDAAEVDEQLRAVKPPKAKRRKQPQSRLWVGQHARERMAQRGMTMSDVSAIWRYGEVTASGDCLVHRLTARAISARGRRGHPLPRQRYRELATSPALGMEA